MDVFFLILDPHTIDSKILRSYRDCIWCIRFDASLKSGFCCICRKICDNLGGRLLQLLFAKDHGALDQQHTSPCARQRYAQSLNNNSIKRFKEEA